MSLFFAYAKCWFSHDAAHIMAVIILIFSIEEECLDDGFGYTPKSLFSWLSRVMYNRRSNINPLWNTYVVAGMQEGEPYVFSMFARMSYVMRKPCS